MKCAFWLRVPSEAFKEAFKEEAEEEEEWAHERVENRTRTRAIKKTFARVGCRDVAVLPIKESRINATGNNKCALLRTRLRNQDALIHQQTACMRATCTIKQARRTRYN